MQIRVRDKQVTALLNTVKLEIEPVNQLHSVAKLFDFGFLSVNVNLI